jgi:hypothetical protein
MRCRSNTKKKTRSYCLSAPNYFRSRARKTQSLTELHPSPIPQRSLIYSFSVYIYRHIYQSITTHQMALQGVAYLECRLAKYFGANPSSAPPRNCQESYTWVNVIIISSLAVCWMVSSGCYPFGQTQTDISDKQISSLFKRILKTREPGWATNTPTY